MPFFRRSPRPAAGSIFVPKTGNIHAPIDGQFDADDLAFCCWVYRMPHSGGDDNQTVYTDVDNELWGFYSNNDCNVYQPGGHMAPAWSGTPLRQWFFFAGYRSVSENYTWVGYSATADAGWTASNSRSTSTFTHSGTVRIGGHTANLGLDGYLAHLKFWTGAGKIPGTADLLVEKRHAAPFFHVAPWEALSFNAPRLSTKRRIWTRVGSLRISGHRPPIPRLPPPQPWFFDVGAAGTVKSPATGNLLLKGGPADLGSKSVIKSPTPGLSLHKGQAIEITRGLPVELTTGQVSLKGATVDVDTSTASKKSPTTERILFKGESFDVQAAIRPALTSGRLLLKGQPLDTQIAVKLALTTGRVVCKGYSPDTRAAVKPGLSTGVIESKGHSFDTQVAVRPEFTTGNVQLFGWPVEAKPAVQAASSVHINAGGTNVDRTDSAGVIWLYDLPFMTSANTNEQFASNTASMSGIVAPLDQNDDQHRALLADSRFDTSSTRNAGSPGILEYSFSLEGNYRYTLRLWGHEVVEGTDVTGGRVMTVAYDYGAGTTATFAATFDIYGLAGAHNKAAVYEQEFAVTADGAQSLRLEIAGGGADDINPLISAIEITSPGLAKVQLDPATPGILHHVGQAPDVSAGVIKKSPSSGVLAYQGQPIVSTEIHYTEVTTGVLSYKGATVNPGNIARVVSPGRGVITCKGASLEVLRKRIFAPSLGLLLQVGGVPDTKIVSAMADATPTTAYLMHKGAAITGEIETDPWTHRDRDAITTWTEVPPDG